MGNDRQPGADAAAKRGSVDGRRCSGPTRSETPEYDVAGIVRERASAALPGITPSNSYRSGDGSYVAIGANRDAIFKQLTKAIGRPELGEDPLYRTNAERTERCWPTR